MNKVKLALAVLSGRKSEFTEKEYYLLGFTSYHLEEGNPDLQLVKEYAEDILDYRLDKLEMGMSRLYQILVDNGITEYE